MRCLAVNAIVDENLGIIYQTFKPNKASDSTGLKESWKIAKYDVSHVKYCYEPQNSIVINCPAVLAIICHSLYKRYGGR